MAPLGDKIQRVLDIGTGAYFSQLALILTVSVVKLLMQEPESGPLIAQSRLHIHIVKMAKFEQVFVVSIRQQKSLAQTCPLFNLRGTY
jgi:hypothetical protein